MRALHVWVALGVCVWVTASMGCARDLRTLKWESKLRAVELSEVRGQTSDALQGYQLLESSSPTRVDADLMRLAQARVLERANRAMEAIDLYNRIARSALRRSDRARAQYEVVDILDRAGAEKQLRPYYRRLVLTYPDLMPGSNALLRLEAAVRHGSLQELDEHLAWTSKHYERLEHTGLADNMLYFAAQTAVQRFRTGDQGAEAVARQLLEAVIDRHPMGNLADDAMWDISYLEQLRGDWEGTVATIRGIQRQRKKAAMLGNYAHRFYRIGELRVARIFGELLDKPREAVKSYDFFVSKYPDDRWRDDALYWLGCLHVRLGDKVQAKEAFDEIREKHPDSRYITRFDAALSDPSSGSCIPREFKHAW